MIKNNKKNKLFVFAFITCLFFAACKRYPENTIWFKNPKKIAIIDGFITEYKVNGIDSLELLNLYYNLTPPPYYKINSGIGNEKFMSGKYNNHGTQIVYSTIFETSGYTKWDKPKKNVELSFSRNDTLYYKKNIFIENTHSWEVIYISAKNKKRKIKTTFDNGNTYEITFN